MRHIADTGFPRGHGERFGHLLRVSSGRDVRSLGSTLQTASGTEYTLVLLAFSLKQRDGHSQRMYARAYLSNLHSFSFVVRRPGSETSGPCSFSISSNLAFPARMWSTIVRSDKSQLWSRSASTIRICSRFDKTIESLWTRPRRRKRWSSLLKAL